jgi:hypothetical protein
MKTKIVDCHTADSKPVKQEVNSTVILSPLVFPGFTDFGHRESTNGEASYINIMLNGCTYPGKEVVQFSTIYEKHIMQSKHVRLNLG